MPGRLNQKSDKRQKGNAYSEAQASGGQPTALDPAFPADYLIIRDMPTYEYICEKCGQQFDEFQSISAKPLTVCPQNRCAKKPWGKGKVKRAISGGAGLLFKGSGFYITDYRSEKYKAAAKKDSSGGGKTEKSAEPKKSDAGAKPAPPKT